MVRLELQDYRGIKGILIDGYLPEFSYLKQIDWEKAMEESLSPNPVHKYHFRKLVYNRYLRTHPQRKLTVRIGSRIYKGLIGSLRTRFCSTNKESCTKLYLPARGHKRLESIVSRSKKKLRDYLPIFSQEINKDEAEGKENYFFDITLLNLKLSKECLTFDECTKNWMDFLNFKIKEKKEYKSFEEFKDACEQLLRYYIDFAIKEELFERKVKKS